ncbi:MAG TPA: hypothetical protein VGK74_07040 [Symbiobacteriaceae bacterium]|jgi:hypothetical protein
MSAMTVGLRRHRIERFQDRALRLMGKVGMWGMGLVLAVSVVRPALLEQGAMQAAMGLCLVLGGAGFAMSGKGTTVREYAEGDSEDLPDVAKLCGGFMAALGGMSLIVLGLFRVMG